MTSIDQLLQPFPVKEHTHHGKGDAGSWVPLHPHHETDFHYSYSGRMIQPAKEPYRSYYNQQYSHKPDDVLRKKHQGCPISQRPLCLRAGFADPTTCECYNGIGSTWLPNAVKAGLYGRAMRRSVDGTILGVPEPYHSTHRKQYE